MSLRPRYSLLTLLVLTALVAGGVKLWYGPHHVVMSDPPTAYEQSILDTHRGLREWGQMEESHFEYGYVNSLNKKVVRYLLCRLNSKHTLSFTSPYDEKIPVRNAKLYTPSRRIIASGSNPPEHLVTILYFITAAEPRVAPDELDPVEEEMRNTVLLSSHRRIYRYAGGAHVEVPLLNIQLQEVAEESQRAVIANELAKIPSGLSAPSLIKPAVYAADLAESLGFRTHLSAEFPLPSFLENAR